MPHDKKGNPLRTGDVVAVRFTVRDVFPSEDYCNLNLETVEPMYPGEHRIALTLNTRQVERIEEGAMAGVGMK